MPPYEWGFMNTPYTPRPDISISGKITNWNKMLQMPRPKFSMLDAGRQQEVDDFYKVKLLIILIVKSLHYLLHLLRSLHSTF